MSRYNACIHQCFERRTKGAGNMVNGLANNAEMDDGGNCDATVVLLKRGNPGYRVPLAPQGEPAPRLPLAASRSRLILGMGSLWKLVGGLGPSVLGVVTEKQDGKGDTRAVKTLTPLIPAV